MATITSNRKQRKEANTTGYIYSSSPEACQHNADLLRGAAVKIKQREAYQKAKAELKEIEKQDCVAMGDFDGACNEIIGMVGTEGRINSLAKYYAGEEAAKEISPFEIEAGDLLVGLMQIPDKISYSEKDIEDTEFPGEMRKVLVENVKRHSSKDAAISFIKKIYQLS